MSAVANQDREILRRLGRELREAAADPINEERRRVCQRVDARQQSRPSIAIYQEPWHELNVNGELDLHCADPFCRGIEQELRRTLYKWRYYPGDMTLAAESVQPYCIGSTGFGIDEEVDIAYTDPKSDIVSRHFHVQIKDESDIAKIKAPVVTHDAAATEEGYQKRSEIFDGILGVRKAGVSSFWFAPWDFLVRLTGVEEVLADLVLRPDYVHRAVSHLVDCWLAMLKQHEEQNLLAAPARELTVSGAAQIFSEVSPAMHAEFALQHEARFYRHFGRVHYGCCEPLHHKVDVCARYLPNMYQISMSPWVDFRKGCESVRDRFVFGWRPNPAFLAHDPWDPNLVRRDIEEKLAIAAEYGCVVAIHLKDISTVRGQPQRLTDWDAIARECAAKYAA
jgi:hypothetical protein